MWSPRALSLWDCGDPQYLVPKETPLFQSLWGYGDLQSPIFMGALSPNPDGAIGIP